MDTRTIINLRNLDRCARFDCHGDVRKVFIFDTTLRDGEQAPGCSMTTSEKVRMARQAGGARRGHHGGGFPDRVRRATSRRCRRSAASCPVKVAALARCTALDIERAAQALEKAKTPPRIHTFLATSDIHLKYKLKKTRAQVLDEAAKAVELARKYVDDVEFSAEDGGRTEVDYLIEVSRAVVAAGASTVNIPDTVGYSHPRGVRRADRPGRQGARRRRRSSASTATTTSAWRSRTRWRPSRTARARSSARSTASASARATARSRRS